MTKKQKDILIKECVILLKKPELKKEILGLFRPVVELLLKEIYPYIYLALILVVISFLLIFGIFVIIMRLKIFMIKKL